MKQTNYKSAKDLLKELADSLKKNYPTDKPLIRMAINDEIDTLSKDFDFTENQRHLLSLYACKLHPKDSE